MASAGFTHAVNAIIDFMLSCLDAINIQILPGIGLVHILFSFIILSIVISVFWKGGRG